jgi:hypothetical protein
MAVLHPAPVSLALLPEVSHPDRNRRFDACVATSAEIWGRGLAYCASLADRDQWIQDYDEHLAWIRRALDNRRTWGLSGPTENPQVRVQSRV